MAPAPLSSSSSAVAPSETPVARPSADVTAITTRDDFLLELGQTLGGKAAVCPVDSLDAALEAMTTARRGQVLVIDAREVADVPAAASAAHASPARPAVVVFAEGSAEKELGTALKGTRVFAVRPLPIDAGKTQAVLEGAISEAIANRSATGPSPAATQAAVLHAPAAPHSDASTGALETPRRDEPEPATAGFPKGRVAGGVAIAAALLAGGLFWFFTQHGKPPSGATPATSATGAGPVAPPPVTPAAAETSLVQGKLDELLEKARLAMHERRFSEPAGDNALLYYRSAAAADPVSAEAHDGLQRVAGVLAGRFEEALNGARLDEAAATLASFRSAAPADGRLASFEQRLYAAQIARALADGNFDRANALVHQGQQSGAVPAEQLARWRADVARHQDEARVQHLAGLIDDRIREGKLVDADDSALTYLQQLQTAAPANAATQRAVHELVSACLRKAREAGLSKNGTEEDRWVASARTAGAKPAEINAFQKELAGVRARAMQAESDQLLQLARQRLHDGHLTDPAQDSAAGYLTQLQSSDAANPALAEAGQELAKALLERARAAVLAGNSGDADLVQAKHWGADAREVAAVAQLRPSAAPAAIDTAALAASLRRVRNVPPDYPPNALAQRITGSVMVEFTVDPKGETRNIHVLESTPPQIFDQAAINAVKHWRYAPMMVNGTAVEVPVKTRMRFELPK